MEENVVHIYVLLFLFPFKNKTFFFLLFHFLLYHFFFLSYLHLFLPFFSFSLVIFLFYSVFHFLFLFGVIKFFGFPLFFFFFPLPLLFCPICRYPFLLHIQICYYLISLTSYPLITATITTLSCFFEFQRIMFLRFLLLPLFSITLIFLSY